MGGLRDDGLSIGRSCCGEGTRYFLHHYKTGAAPYTHVSPISWVIVGQLLMLGRYSSSASTYWSKVDA